MAQQVADRLEAAAYGEEHRLVDRLEVVARRDLAEALGDHGGGAVDQVPPAGDQLGVVAGDELAPGERRVGGLRPGRADVVAQRVGAVALQEVADQDDVAPAGGELGVAHREELRGDHLGRQVELAVLPRPAAAVALAGVRQHLGRPDLGVEDDVVLAHEVVGHGPVVVPPLPPLLRLAEPAGPLDRGGEVADDRVEPDVEPLGGLVLPAGHRDAPVDVARHRARPDLLEDVLAVLDDVGPPGAGRLALVEPLPQRAGEGGQVEEVVLGLDELRRLAVDLAPGLDQVGGVELVAAVVALVPARVGVAADRTGALDVAVGQRTAGRGADRRLGGLLDHVAVAVAGTEHLLHDPVVVAGRGPREQVVRQPQTHEIGDDERVVAVGQLLGRDALLVGGHQDRGAVLVGAGDHQHVVAGHAHVAAEDVGGHAETGHVADVARAVGVRPGDGGQDMRHDGDPRRGPTAARTRSPPGTGAGVSRLVPGRPSHLNLRPSEPDTRGFARSNLRPSDADTGGSSAQPPTERRRHRRFERSTSDRATPTPEVEVRGAPATSLETPYPWAGPRGGQSNASMRCWVRRRMVGSRS